MNAHRGRSILRGQKRCSGGGILSDLVHAPRRPTVRVVWGARGAIERAAALRDVRAHSVASRVVSMSRDSLAAEQWCEPGGL